MWFQDPQGLHLCSIESDFCLLRLTAIMPQQTKHEHKPKADELPITGSQHGTHEAYPGFELSRDLVLHHSLTLLVRQVSI